MVFNVPHIDCAHASIDKEALQISVDYSLNDRSKNFYSSECREFCFVFKENSIKFLSVFNAYRINTEPGIDNVFLRPITTGR